jgi:lipopolysaccharide transport system permease protein
MIFLFLMCCFYFATAGFSLFLATTGDYVRDIVQITGVITSTLIFLAPIFTPFPLYLKIVKSCFT